MGNLYDFHDLEPRGEPNASFLMPETLTYNGHCLDQEIPRFYTMSTDGRNNFERELNAPAKVGDGNYYLSSRIKERTICDQRKRYCPHGEYQPSVSFLLVGCLETAS